MYIYFDLFKLPESAPLDLFNYVFMFQYYFELKIDGVRKWRLENRNSRSFSNVKIWAAQCRHGFPPANAYIDNLQYDSIGKIHIHALI